MKKLFVLLFALLICAVCFAACNEESTPKKDAAPVTDNTADTGDTADTSDTVINSDTNVDTVTDQTDKATATDTAAEPDASDQKISEEELKDIVLLHAGLSEEEISAYFAISDYDDDRNIPEYDVSFYSGDFEYEYEVNALTGEITDFEKESRYD